MNVAATFTERRVGTVAVLTLLVLLATGGLAGMVIGSLLVHVLHHVGLADLSPS